MRALAHTGPFQELLGYRGWMEADGSVMLELTVHERHLNQYGFAHGGVVLALLDAAGGLAVLAAVAPWGRVATISMATSFVRGVRPGPVRARGHLEHLGSTVAHTRMELLDADGRLLAAAQGAYRIFQAPQDDGEAPTP